MNQNQEHALVLAVVAVGLSACLTEDVKKEGSGQSIDPAGETVADASSPRSMPDASGTDDEPPCYVDSDGDGFGAGGPVDCSDADFGADGAVIVPSTNNRDCDDEEAVSAPGLMEMCDGLDNNCDGEIDEGLTNECGGPCGQRIEHMPGSECSNGLLGACAKTGAYVCQGTSAVVCNAPQTAPSPELCGDNIDNDCDGQTNESDASDAPTWYQDCDGDGFAASITGAIKGCVMPANAGACTWTSVIPQPATKSNWDCNDASKNYSPAVTAYGFPTDGSSSPDLNCNGTADKDPGIVGTSGVGLGARRELCTRLNAEGCGHWKTTSGDYVLAQPACSASASNSFPAGYRYCSGQAPARVCLWQDYDGIQLCR